MLLDWIALTARLPKKARIADIGCGTGISARLWAARGVSVIGVDPNNDMLTLARAEGGGPEYQSGSAQATGLPDSSVDLISCAQSFHWFDVDKAQTEFSRVLKPSGRACAFWNLRSRGEFMDAYETVISAHCTDSHEATHDRAAITRLLGHQRTLQASEATFSSSQPMEREAFFGRVRSASYVAHGLKEPDNFWEALDKLFDKYEKGGMITFLYDSIAVVWKVR
jgi:ubiquinone/menaquinone biosynthesis C-methylase UbiE